MTTKRQKKHKETQNDHKTHKVTTKRQNAYKDTQSDHKET